MRSFNLGVDEKYFNLLWRSINSRKKEILLKTFEEPEDSDDAALLDHYNQIDACLETMFNEN